MRRGPRSQPRLAVAAAVRLHSWAFDNPSKQPVARYLGAVRERIKDHESRQGGRPNVAPRSGFLVLSLCFRRASQGTFESSQDRRGRPKRRIDRSENVVLGVILLRSLSNFASTRPPDYLSPAYDGPSRFAPKRKRGTRRDHCLLAFPIWLPQRVPPASQEEHDESSPTSSIAFIDLTS